MLVTALVQVASGIPSPTYFSSKADASLESSVSQFMFAPGELALNLSHVPVFAFLAFTWAWSLQAWSGSIARASSIGLVLTLSFAALNELSQIAVPTRYASLGDAVLNVVGAAIGLALMLYVRSIPTAA